MTWEIALLILLAVAGALAIIFAAYDIGRTVGHVEGFHRGLKIGHEDWKFFERNKGTANSVENPERAAHDSSST